MLLHASASASASVPRFYLVNNPEDSASLFGCLAGVDAVGGDDIWVSGVLEASEPIQEPEGAMLEQFFDPSTHTKYGAGAYDTTPYWLLKAATTHSQVDIHIASDLLLYCACMHACVRVYLTRCVLCACLYIHTSE
jgi:hypothetical protein